MTKKTFATAGALMAVALSMSAAPAPVQAQSTPMIGQLMATGYTFCPRGWTGADGQLLPINQYQALFSLYGTIYGGDGRTTFALPDLRGRTPIHEGTGPGLQSTPLGQRSGQEQFTLVTGQIPAHTHVGRIAAHPTPGNAFMPVRNSISRTNFGQLLYSTVEPPANNMNFDTLKIFDTGGNQPVVKQSPYQVLRWCVALQGLFPSRN